MHVWTVIGDLQMPFQDDQALNLALAFIDHLKPDGIILNGDITDCYALSAYDKNPLTPASLALEIAQTHSLMGRLANIPQKVWVGGNHEDRLRRYLWKRAPELGILPQLDFPQLFGLADFGFTWMPYGELYRLGKLAVTHGTLVRKHSGQTAKAHFEKYGTSVLINHTHRLGAYYKRTIEGVHGAWENGCLCRLDPEYEAHPDWQQGFSVVHVDPECGFFHVQQLPILRQARGKPFLIYGGELVSA
jgi:predicted phosphodiesterase